MKKGSTLLALGITGSLFGSFPAWALDLAAIQTSMEIPPELASVVDAWAPKDHPLETPIILIEDVHRHTEAQKNMASLLVSLGRQWNQHLFVEGAFTTVSATDEASSDELTGPELADRWLAEAKQTGFELIGMEQPTLYRENLEAFAEVDTVRDAALRQWRTTQVMNTLFDIRSPASILVERLIDLRLTPDQYDQYKKISRPKTENETISEALDAAEAYYKIVNQRSDVFAQRLLAEGSGTHVAVVGGFHCRRMTERFQHAGRAYVVIAPKVTRGGYAANYEDHMRQAVDLVLGPAPLRTLTSRYTSLRP